MLETGIALSIIGAITALAGLMMVLTAAFNKNKKAAKRGAYVLAAGGTLMLISFAFCTGGLKGFK